MDENEEKSRIAALNRERDEIADLRMFIGQYVADDLEVRQTAAYLYNLGYRRTTDE